MDSNANSHSSASASWGIPMAGHLQRAGHDVVVYNRTAAKAEQWVAQHGGRSARTPADAAARRARS